MRDDSAAEGLRAELRYDRLVRKAVKAVFEDTSFMELARQWQPPRDLRHSPVEVGVEAGDLGQLRKPRGDRLDPEQGGR